MFQKRKNKSPKQRKDLKQECNTKFETHKKNRSKYKRKEDTGSDNTPNSNISGQIVRIRKSQNFKRNMSQISKETTILAK